LRKWSKETLENWKMGNPRRKSNIRKRRGKAKKLWEKSPEEEG